MAFPIRSIFPILSTENGLIGPTYHDPTGIAEVCLRTSPIMSSWWKPASWGFKKTKTCTANLRNRQLDHEQHNYLTLSCRAVSSLSTDSMQRIVHVLLNFRLPLINNINFTVRKLSYLGASPDSFPTFRGTFS